MSKGALSVNDIQLPFSCGGKIGKRGGSFCTILLRVYSICAICMRAMCE